MVHLREVSSDRFVGRMLAIHVTGYKFESTTQNENKRNLDKIIRNKGQQMNKNDKYGNRVLWHTYRHSKEIVMFEKLAYLILIRCHPYPSVLDILV